MQWFWRECHEHSPLQLNPLIITQIQYHEASPEFLKLNLRQDWTLLRSEMRQKTGQVEAQWKQWWQIKKHFEWVVTVVNKWFMGKCHRFPPPSFLSVYTMYDITAYVYLQYMYTSRQGVHLLEVLIPGLMQDNIIMLRFRLWHNRRLKEQTEPRAKNSQPHKAAETLDFTANSKQDYSSELCLHLDVNLRAVYYNRVCLIYENHSEYGKIQTELFTLSCVEQFHVKSFLDACYIWSSFKQPFCDYISILKAALSKIFFTFNWVPVVSVVSLNITV